MILEQMNESRMKEYYDEVGMTRDGVKRDVCYIKDWIKAQPHLPNLPDDKETEEWLERMLVNSKNRMHKVKNVLEFYYTAKSAVPELMANRNPCQPDMLHSYTTLNVLALPKLTPEGYRVSYFGREVADVENFNSVVFMKRILMCTDLFVRHDVNRGMIGVFDFNNSKLALWAKYNPALLKKFIVIMQKAFPYPMKSVIIINAPAFVASVFPLLSDKIRSRLQVYSSKENHKMFDIIPKECLPKDLGGTYDMTIKELNEMWWKELVTYKDWFVQQEEVKADLSKRDRNVDKRNDQMNDLFGNVGTFRNINID